MEKYFGLLIGILILLTVVLTAILGLVVYFVFFKKGSPQSSSKQEDHDKKIFKSIGQLQIQQLYRPASSMRTPER